MDLNKQRGSRIESLRASKGISQLELAKMLGYKSDSTISKWESGASIPTGTKIVKLAQVLGLLRITFFLETVQKTPRNNNLAPMTSTKS